MADNVFTSFIELLRTNPIISPQLGDYKGIKGVHAVVRPDDSNEIPTLTVRPEIDDILPSKNTEQLFIINVYDTNPVKCKYISRLICGTLDDRTFTISGVTMRISCSGLTFLGDSTTKEFNSPVSARVVYYGD